MPGLTERVVGLIGLCLVVCAMLRGLSTERTSTVRITKHERRGVGSSSVADTTQGSEPPRAPLQLPGDVPPPTQPPSPSAAGPSNVRKPCPAGCTTRGNCDERTGTCTCPFTHMGAACSVPLLPACELADGEPINLSFLVSEEAWRRLRDVSRHDARRLNPPFRWIGPVPCQCLLQANALFSLEASATPAEWPPFIEHPFLSMQRVACVDSEDSLATLWQRGQPTNESLPWSYVPIFAFLKTFPAHAPLLLPPGAVSEQTYIRPRSKFAIDLLERSARVQPRPVRMALDSMLPAMRHRIPILLPLNRCGPSACHHAGWCNGMLDSAMSTPTCECAFGPDFRGHVPSLQGQSNRVADKCGHDSVATIKTDWWRHSERTTQPQLACPNNCQGRGSCAYGFCHCQAGFWGLDCGLSLPRLVALAATAATVRPRIHVYELPPSARRSCNVWHLPEDVGDRLLRSDHIEPDPSQADLFWVYGCPNGDTILPALRWIKHHHSYWNASVAAGTPRHVMVVGHEEGFAEVWRYLVHWLRGEYGDHANKGGRWDELHPASPTRQLAVLQLSGRSDYPAEGQRKPIRCVSSDAPCYVCFQRGKDVAIPGHPGLIDYPRHPDCSRFQTLAAFDTAGVPRPRKKHPRVLFGGAIWTVPQGVGFYEPSRLVLYLCHKNASARGELDALITQTETQPEAVRPWQVERRVDLPRLARDAAFCIVPEGKIGGYGHRVIAAIMLGCVPIFTTERFSSRLFDEAINWSALSIHVPPVDMARLPSILSHVDDEPLRRAAAATRRRLLWTSIYGPCHLRAGEGGVRDAFDTLMEVLAVPRRHFTLSAAHRRARAPELHRELANWLRTHQAAQCAKAL